jgi:hypothetical protein
VKKRGEKGVDKKGQRGGLGREGGKREARGRGEREGGRGKRKSRDKKTAQGPSDGEDLNKRTSGWTRRSGKRRKKREKKTRRKREKG